MIRFILILAGAIALAAIAYFGLVWVNTYFGFVPTATPQNRLELLKIVPATLAVVASVFTAAVSVLSIRLQRESTTKIEELKLNFQKDLVRFGRRFALADKDADRARQLLDRVRASASSYHAGLKSLETGHFSPTKIAKIEKAAETLGGEIPRDSLYLEPWYRFCQQGYCLTDLAKRKSSISERKSIWKEEGPLFGSQFENLITQLRLEEDLIRANELLPHEEK